LSLELRNDGDGVHSLWPGQDLQRLPRSRCARVMMADGRRSRGQVSQAAAAGSRAWQRGPPRASCPRGRGGGGDFPTPGGSPPATKDDDVSPLGPGQPRSSTTTHLLFLPLPAGGKQQQPPMGPANRPFP
jgi:hypothetical protein